MFEAFLNATDGLEFESYIEYHPDGTGVVILASPFPDISLCLTRTQLVVLMFFAVADFKKMQNLRK